MRPVQNGTDTQRLTEEHGLCAARRSPGVHVFYALDPCRHRVDRARDHCEASTASWQQSSARRRYGTDRDVVVGDAGVGRTSQTWAETLVRFLTNRIVASLLMTIGLLGILVEFRAPGFGLPGVVGLLSFAVLFWGHWLVQLAGWEELLLGWDAP